jgi:RNA polymerase sigma-70 factor (ECF subfamily)
LSEESGVLPAIRVKKARAKAYDADPMEAQASQLMARAKNGDREAFAELVQQLRGRAFAVARSLVGSREDALDLSQEAFLKTYRARETYREGEPFLPWFHRILRNTCFTHLRKSRRLKKVSLTSGPEESSGNWEIEDEAPPPSADMEADERARAFWTGFNQLSSRDREILGLRHFKELTYQQIADALSIPIGTVMSRLFHARRRLREALGPLMEDVGDALPTPSGRRSPDPGEVR